MTTHTATDRSVPIGTPAAADAPVSADAAHPADALLAVFNRLHADNLQLLDDVYAPDVRFLDPAHELQGLPAVKRYFAGLYANVTECAFTVESRLRGAEESVLMWTMHLRHARLSGGARIALPGASHLRHGAGADARVHYHRDYFDLGALVYERVPVLGPVVRSLKRRLGG